LFFKQKTAYEIIAGDWSSDVCSSDLDHSSLTAFLTGALKGLWLCDSVNSLWLALLLGTIVAWPRLAGRGLVMMLALGPVANAVAIYATMGNFFAGHLLLFSGALALAAGALSH